MHHGVEWLNGSGSFDLSHVGNLPAELIKDVAHDFLAASSAAMMRRQENRERHPRSFG